LNIEVGPEARAAKR